MNTNKYLPQVDYPHSIRGSLRLILQLKDYFIAAFDATEEYRSILMTCQHGFSRSLAVHQLSIGLASLKQLRQELAEIDRKVKAKVIRNRALRHYLKRNTAEQSDQANNYVMRSIRALTGISIPSSKSKEDKNGHLICGLLPSGTASEVVTSALHGGLQSSIGEVNVDKLDIPPEIDLSSATTESGSPLLPVVDFYRGFYFLQMHFQVIMCQAANYAMPVMTQSLGLSERVFGWPTAPAFGMGRKSGPMGDKLLEIHNEVINLIQRLQHCLVLVQSKVRQDRVIESYYRKQLVAQEMASSSLLRCLQIQRTYADTLEAQNDRLTGIAVKVDRNFPKNSLYTDFTNSEGIYDYEGSLTVDESVTETELVEGSPGEDGSNSSMLHAQLRPPTSSDISVRDSVPNSKRQRDDSKNATEIITVTGFESVNQLLLGSDSVAPGLGTKKGEISMKSSESIVHNKADQTKHLNDIAFSKRVSDKSQNTEAKIKNQGSLALQSVSEIATSLQLPEKNHSDNQKSMEDIKSFVNDKDASIIKNQSIHSLDVNKHVSDESKPMEAPSKPKESEAKPISNDQNLTSSSLNIPHVAEMIPNSATLDVNKSHDKVKPTEAENKIENAELKKNVSDVTISEPSVKLANENFNPDENKLSSRIAENNEVANKEEDIGIKSVENEAYVLELDEENLPSIEQKSSTSLDLNKEDGAENNKNNINSNLETKSDQLQIQNNNENVNVINDNVSNEVNLNNAEINSFNYDYSNTYEPLLHRAHLQRKIDVNVEAIQPEQHTSVSSVSCASISTSPASYKSNDSIIFGYSGFESLTSNLRELQPPGYSSVDNSYSIMDVNDNHTSEDSIIKNKSMKTIHIKFDEDNLRCNEALKDEMDERQISSPGPSNVPLDLDDNCLPNWLKNTLQKADYTPTEGELLIEPKRSALSRSLRETRQHLVESILRADEDRLAEILKVLLRRN